MYGGAGPRVPLRGTPGNFGRGEVGHEQEKQGIPGHVQIEIHEAVHQEPATCDKSGEMQRRGERFVGDQQLLERTEEQHTQEPGTTEGTR